jgi:hypothetical protein
MEEHYLQWVARIRRASMAAMAAVAAVRRQPGRRRAGSVRPVVVLECMVVVAAATMILATAVPAQAGPAPEVRVLRLRATATRARIACALAAAGAPALRVSACHSENGATRRLARKLLSSWRPCRAPRPVSRARRLLVAPPQTYRPRFALLNPPTIAILFLLPAAPFSRDYGS